MALSFPFLGFGFRFYRARRFAHCHQTHVPVPVPAINSTFWVFRGPARPVSPYLWLAWLIRPPAAAGPALYCVAPAAHAATSQRNNEDPSKTQPSPTGHRAHVGILLPERLGVQAPKWHWAPARGVQSGVLYPLMDTRPWPHLLAPFGAFSWIYGDRFFGGPSWATPSPFPRAMAS